MARKPWIRSKPVALTAAVLIGFTLSSVETAQAAPTPAIVSTQSGSMPAKRAVTPGAYCSNHGATGYTKTGKKMKCKRTARDHRYRWRKA